MRKVIYGGACSLDGFLTDRDGGVGWLHWSKDVEEVMRTSWATVDAMVFGRKTWEVAAKAGGDGPPGPRMKAYLCSRTLSSVPVGAPELVREDAGDFLRRLKQQPGKDIIVMSGGNLARSLLQAGVIDEVGFNIHPILLGSGVPALLDPGVAVKLALEECRQMDGGCVLVRYRTVA